MTFGSLFGGIGGLDLGLERAGMECVWQVEIDDYATRVLEKHWPDVRRWRDVRTFPPEPIDDWQVGLICGGFPCQDLSPAGKGKGLKGSRSGLWYQMRRIVASIEPQWVVIENTHSGWRRWVPFVRRDLWKLGYASLPIRLRASDFGLLHRRARAFVVANSNGVGCDWRRRLQEAAEETGRISPEGNYAISADIDGRGQLQPKGAHVKKRRRTRNGVTQVGSVWTIEPCLGGRLHGIPSRVDRLKCLGNAVVPQVAEWIGKRIMEAAES